MVSLTAGNANSLKILVNDLYATEDIVYPVSFPAKSLKKMYMLRYDLYKGMHDKAVLQF